MNHDERTVRVTCTHDCPDACSALVTVVDGKAVDIRADASHPVTGRHLCVKVDRYLERVYSPDRVLTPLRRVGAKGAGEFEAVSWDAALDEIASRWKQIIADDGGEAILPYSYLGSMGALAAFGPTWGLFHDIGASQLERSICGGQSFGLQAAVGTTRFDPEHLPDAALIVAWGIDVVSTSIHTWDLIRKAKANGARLVVVDPYRSRTARRADLHIAPRPGTDGALALGVANVIIDEGLLDESFVDDHTTGFDDYAAAVKQWTPDETASVTGVDTATIVELARAYATTHPAAIRIGVGMQRAAGSGMAMRAIHCLPVLTGQWRHRGGGIADASTTSGLGFWSLWRLDGGPPSTRTINMIRLGSALTDPDLTPPVRGLFVWNSNPAVIAADQSRVLEGLARDDLFTVVHDQFVTDTARYADVVLPAPTMIEHDDLVGSWGFNYVSRNRAAIEPIGESRPNSDVARALAHRMGFDNLIYDMSDDEMIKRCLSSSLFGDPGLADQLDDGGFVRIEPPGGDAPHANGAFSGPNGKFEFSSQALDNAFGLGPVATFVPPAESPETSPGLAERYPLRLLTLKRHHSINSSYGGLPVMHGAEPELIVELHPDDAARRALGEGEAVRVWNDRGEVRGTLRSTDDVLAGSVVVPFGRWLDGGLGANALTSDRLGDMGGGPTFCDALVEVGPIPRDARR